MSSPDIQGYAIRRNNTCSEGELGYYILNTIWVGCLDGTGDVTGDYQRLTVISSGTPSSTPTSTSAAASTSTSATTSDGSSHTNPGAIAGGVVGGVVGVAAIVTILFFLIQSRKQQHQQAQQPAPPFSTTVEKSQPKELEGQGKAELMLADDHPDQQHHELPAAH
ncbi:hypothetical protein VTN00DRAFT_3306 [Thermoascus crustaceus]|uniref:uncharacterized protein n=1 Tax=Thermoascus crustaceus TaxID=5088 RepID=UPI003742C679